MSPISNSKGADESPFLFVNHDASTHTWSKQDAKLYRSKQSHVQRQYFAKKSQALLEKPQRVSITTEADHSRSSKRSTTWSQKHGMRVLKSLAPAKINSAPLPLEQTADVHTSQNASGDILLHQESDHRSQGHVNDSSRTASESSSHGSKSRPLTKLEIVERLSKRSVPRSVPETTALWFGSASLPETDVINIDAWCKSLVPYYTTVVVPSIFRADSRAKGTVHVDRHLENLDRDIRQCMSDATYFYTFLAAAAARMQYGEGKLLVPGISALERARGQSFLRKISLRGIRSYLEAGNVDDHLLTGVFRLWTSEIFARNYGAARLHVRALDYMVRMMGGLHTMNQFLMEKIITADIYCAASRLSRPDLELTWDPGDLPPELLVKVTPPKASPLQSLGQGFLISDHAGLFHGNMQRILIDLVPETFLNIYSWSHSGLTDHDLSYMLLRRTAIEHRLLSFPIIHAASDPQDYIQEVVRISLIFWIGIAFADPIRRQTILPLLPLLRQAMEKSQLQDLWYPHSHLLLWALVNGAILAENTDDYDWFATRAANTATSLHISDEQSLRAILRNFFYLDESHEDAAKRLCQRFQKEQRDTETVAKLYCMSTPRR